MSCLITPTQVTIEFTSEDTVLLTWPEIIDNQQHQKILWLDAQLSKVLAEIVLDSVIGFNSIMIVYQPQLISLLKLKTVITQLISKTPERFEATIGNTIKIPVYYSTESGWDLAQVAKSTKLTKEQVINLHSNDIYRAYAQGFTPGFCYLAKLANQLTLPRKKVPRTKVPAGAVAIAGQQSAVYPEATPGGWHILGQTPLPMFQKTGSGLITTIKVGDLVQFYPITKQEFEDQGGQLISEQA
ncbi:5-oxoprolinase subunit PxpB [Thalassotalea sp. M1531]|uniref:5-oxoprolinase subunit PxpB n=1 Tax=Thalassotalea algicola TaxID=2716224 RepID=A0A7Y0LC17_9GAMM|nr:5-oxoprolinase subunit PxpB [Thalassotalea algicola]NMP31676.1 5-oxoprolinase subunit PxpB [Thalassotalea algicola]